MSSFNYRNLGVIRNNFFFTVFFQENKDPQNIQVISSYAHVILDTYFQRLTNDKRLTEKQGKLKLRIKSTKYCRHQHFPIYSRAHKKVFEYGITSGLTGVIIPLRNKADYLLFLGRTISYSNQITVSNFLKY